MEPSQRHRNFFRLGRKAWAASIASILATAQSAHAENENTLNEVVVTGSRIKRSEGFDAPVPFTVVGESDINESGRNILGDVLGNLPQVLAGVSLQNSSSTLFNAGQSRVDMRGLGSARTLLLVDGRRHLTGDFRTSSVDLNLIPSTLIDRIEVVSGGASAVYGSEAISGVVNILLKKKLDGIRADVQAGISDEGDGAEYKASAAYGLSFADGRGSWLIGGEFGKVDPVYQVDRDWAYPGVRRDTTRSPQPIIPQSRSNTMSTATFQFVRNSTTSLERSSSISLDRTTSNVNSTACRTSTVSPQCQDPWLIYLGQYNALQSKLTRRALRSYVDFALTDNITLFGDLSLGQVDGTALSVPSFSNAAGGGTMPVVVRGDYAYLNDGSSLSNQIRSQWLATRPVGTTTLTRTDTAQIGKIWEEFGMRNSDTHRSSYRVIGGLEGKSDLFERNIDWQFSGQYSRLTGYVVAYGVPNVLRVQQATDAVLLGGQIVCSDASARAQGCQPWDLIHGPSAAAVDWTNATARTDGVATQLVVDANLNAPLFELPAGSLNVAVGGEYRKETSDQIQDALSASNALFYNAIGRTQGEYSVKEAYTEVVVPLLKDLPAAHRLSVEAAGRIGDYSSVGSVNQWRLQATWAPIEAVSFRGSKSIAVRAPNITELFGPQGRNFTTTANDPCDRAQVAGIASDPARQALRIANCTAVIPGYNSTTFVSNVGTGRPSLPLLQGGNPDLSEESADTVSAGVVVKPLQNFNISLDYWKIELKDAINVIPINTLLANLCYDAPEAPASNRFCRLIRRDATGATTGGLVGGLAEVVLTNQNVQAIETSGYDLSIQYGHDYGHVGRFQLQLDGTKVVRWDLAGVPGGPITHYAGTLTGVNGAVPRYKASATLKWSLGDYSLQWQTRFQDSYAVSEIDPPSSRDPFYTGQYYEHDLQGAYAINESLKVRLGINNLSNEHPPLVPEVGNATSAQASTYDNTGRFVFVGVNYQFGR